MTQDEEQPTERSRLLPNHRRRSLCSIISHQSKEQFWLGETSVGERLPYNNYTTIDWLHDLVKSSNQHRSVHGHPGLRGKAAALWDSSQGWIIATISGVITAVIAAFIDIAVITVSDWKVGYCKGSLLSGEDFCCSDRPPFPTHPEAGQVCPRWHAWAGDYWSQFAVYVAFAILFGIISGGLTLLTKTSLPSATTTTPEQKSTRNSSAHSSDADTPETAQNEKSLYMAAGSGIPEIKTVLSGFVMPGLLSTKVLLVKAFGSIFAVSTGMCLGKEGPFVHVSVCVAHLVGNLFPKFANNGRKIREVYAAGCAAGLSVAFGAPIGGVLFAYEEISTYFPRKVMWRAFICSLCAAIVLRQLDPTGTGRLVLFETDWATSYQPYHYIVFILLGILGGVFGGVFCRLNYAWSRWFRSFAPIKSYPVLEVVLVVLATGLLQYPNPLTREPGDVIFKTLLVNCGDPTSSSTSPICRFESHPPAPPSAHYLLLLLHGSLTKLILTTLTFGIKVPSGIIIPALDAGAFTGRLLGQLPFLSLNPGILAMVGAAAFLAGVSRMTVSLAVIMFELTGSLEYTVPTMVSIMVAKWTADALSKESVYDLAQSILSHPFLDGEVAMEVLLDGSRRGARKVRELCPPPETMGEIMLEVGSGGTVDSQVLADKLALLKRRGLLDAGLVLVREGRGTLLGYLAQGDLEGGLQGLEDRDAGGSVRVMQPVVYGEGREGVEELPDLSSFVDRTPLTLSACAPMEYAIELFAKLGLRYLMVEEETGLEQGEAGVGRRLVGVVIKKRLVDYIERLKWEAD